MGRCDLIPVALIDIKHHTKFQVAAITGTLKSTSYKILTLQKLALQNLTLQKLA